MWPGSGSNRRVPPAPRPLHRLSARQRNPDPVEASFLSRPILVGYLNGIALLIIVDPNRELIGFGAGNLVSGLAQDFPVTGADSRTAVNEAMGGKSQMVGRAAGGVMLLSLFFLTEPLAYVPNAALAAVIIVAAVGLFDVSTLRELSAMSRVELGFSVGTTLGVLVLGVLPGVLLAVVLSLSLSLFLMLTSRPTDAILGRVPGLSGYHDLKDYPEAETLPGLLLYRFNTDLVFDVLALLGEKPILLIYKAVPVYWRSRNGTRTWMSVVDPRTSPCHTSTARWFHWCSGAVAPVVWRISGSSSG